LEGFAVRRAAELLSVGEIAELGQVLADLADSAERGDLAAFRAHNERFHLAIVDRGASGGVLMQLIQQLTRNVARYAPAGNVLDRAYLEASQAEHVELYAFLRNKDGERAESLARQHALTFANHLMRRLEEQGQDTVH
jgi:DNA-binding GntR family transcriptional regulator